MTWLNKAAVLWVIHEAPDVPPSLLAALIMIAAHTRADGRGAYPAAATVAAEIRKSESQAKRDVAALEKLGLIVRGDQSLAGGIRADRRPVVYDLPPAAQALLRGSADATPSESRGSADATSSRGSTDATSLGHGVAPVHARGSTGARHGVAPVPYKEVLEEDPEDAAARSASADALRAAGANVRDGPPAEVEKYLTRFRSNGHKPPEPEPEDGEQAQHDFSDDGSYRDLPWQP